ncbi:MAG TPA: hypothetical protein VGL94_16525, partial [Ktedonobacteraceae bacterium]
VANFCYPRFFDYRTESLHMRPVGRAKRQEVWLYLSSVDFTAWSRVDLTAADFQHQIEGLFIQFMQRNRSFFGPQGRRRMSDVRMLIGSCAGTVAQGLRNHLTGQRQGNPPFGSPRPTVSWSATAISEQPGLHWEQISASTMILQQQLQELRGELKPADVSQERPSNLAVPARPTSSTNSRISASSAKVPRVSRPQVTAMPSASVNPLNSPEFDMVVARQLTVVPMPPSTNSRVAAQVTNGRGTISSGSTPLAAIAPTRRLEPSAIPVERLDPARSKSEPLSPLIERSAPVRKSGQLTSSAPPFMASTPMVPLTSPKSVEGRGRTSALPDSATSPVPVAQPQARRVPPSDLPVTNGTTSSSQRDMMSVGEDDLAIFEQMRHQLILWLRIEAVSAGLEIAGQGPAQLLEMLRQQSRIDETRLQVVSTLLNLANQVVKTSMVTVLDYKQALMFHLMHTRRF